MRFSFADDLQFTYDHSSHEHEEDLRRESQRYLTVAFTSMCDASLLAQRKDSVIKVSQSPLDVSYEDIRKRHTSRRWVN